jgi:serine/threonine-protein kinase HipA
VVEHDALNVWSDQRLVGYLWRNPVGYIGFRYNPQWITQGGFAVSHALPLGRDDYTAEGGAAHRFFANLLPEGGVRERIVRDLKISNTDFDLLRAIGGECAGALSILPVEQQPSVQYSYHSITDEELANLVTRRGQVYNWATKDRPRLSLAGAQDKCPILVRDGNYLLPRQESPSSHILKFELADYRHLPAYEAFTTQLAKAVGLPVVDIQLRSIGQKHYALIERYDRLWNECGEVQRLHQEDFCQALGYGHERKYQEDGGPTFAQCYQLVRDVSSDPANDLLHLLRWQIFNVLAGNSDGHAKNLSLLYLTTGEIRLTPFYDLVCTRAIERIDYHLAFAVGEERNPGVITRKHWEILASQCDLRPQFLLNQVHEIAARLLDNLNATKTAFESQFGKYAALQRVEQVVSKQCRRAGKI